MQDTAYRFPIRNSAEPETLTSVMSVTRTMFPAREYGMFLWSHGTGWLPEGYYSTKSFGSENGVEMDIKDLAKALPYTRALAPRFLPQFAVQDCTWFEWSR